MSGLFRSPDLCNTVTTVFFQGFPHGHAAYGEVLPDGVLGDEENFSQRGSVVLVRIDGVWVTAEAVRSSELNAWKERKSTGPGRDPRLLPARHEAGGRATAPSRKLCGLRGRRARTATSSSRGHRLSASRLTAFCWCRPRWRRGGTRGVQTTPARGGPHVFF